MNSVKVNIIGGQGKSFRSYDSDVDEKAKYLAIEFVGFQAKGQLSDQDNWNSRQGTKVRTNMGIDIGIRVDRDGD